MADFLMTVWSGLALLMAVWVTLPIGVVFVECLVAAMAASPSPAPTADETVSLAVLMPAHNEATGIAETLAHLMPQLRGCDRILVVADNCTDQTASLATAAGAAVVERHDPEHRGKGYALDFGLRHLTSDPPDVIVIIDADCRVAPNGLQTLAAQAALTQRPAQAIYLLEPPEPPSSKALISAFAFRVKNWVRPLGLYRLGLPCLLFGTGMAFPWASLRAVNLASSHIVEDMKLGLDLAIEGYPPRLCPTVQVTSQFPQGDAAATQQRTRWEHGHLQVLRDSLPPLVKAALKQQRGDLIALALELAVPPLSLLVLLWLVAFTLSLVSTLWLSLNGVPTGVLALDGVLLISAILLAWYRFARQDLPASALFSSLLYVIWKLPLYLKFWVKPQSDWVRTERQLAKPTEEN